MKNRNIYLGALLAFIVAGVVVLASSSWETFYITTSDGVSTPAIVSHPDGVGPFPTIVYFHTSPGGIGESGLMTSTTGDSGKRWNRWLAEGYAVVIADYRQNNPSSPLDIVYVGDPNAVDDAQAIINHVKGLSYVDPARMGIIGSSLGGTILLEVIRATDNSMKAAIIEYGPVQKFVGNKAGFPNGCPDLTNSQINRPSTETKIATISIPVRFTQGTSDGLCAINKKLYNVMIEKGKTAVLTLYTGSPHGFTKGPDGTAFQQALTDNVNFFATYVK